LKIGLLSLVALTLAVTLIFLVGGEGGFFWQRYKIKVRFPNAMGLKQGAVVRLAGVDIGTVSSVAFSGTEVEVVLDISRRMQHRITTESRASIGSLSLLGESTVDLTPESAGTAVPPWGYVEAAPSVPQMADLSARAASGLDEMTRLMTDLRGGRGTLGKLLTDEAVYAELDQFLRASESVMSAVGRGEGTLGRLVKDPATFNELKGSLENLRAITARISAGEGSLGRLLADDGFAQSAAGAARNLDELTAKISRGDGTAGRLVNDAALYERLDSLTGRLDTLTGNLNQGEGTAGRLLTDRELYENMNGAIGDLRQLVADIRANPKKYLNVKVSVF
jgi:phospholipid/cholesterol/gamma-HCH transport system substrate-binding protein